MVSILDLKRRFVEVPTEAGNIRMWAVSFESLSTLVTGFPIAKKLLDGKATDKDLSPMVLLDTAPKFVAELIAAGSDMAGDKAAIKAAADAPVGVQVLLLAGVLEASLPGGAAPFLEALAKVRSVLNSGMKALVSA